MTAAKQQAAPGWRFSLAMGVLAALALLLVWRVLSLQVLDTDRGYEFLQDQGDARSIRTEVIPAYRGLISDRNGEPLSISTPVASVWINPRQLMQAKEKWQALANVVEIKYQRVKQKVVGNRNRRFVYLRRHMSPDAAEKVMRLNIPGVYVQREFKRYYPAGEVASHVVGFTNIDDKGQEGMELAFDQWLQGTSGSKQVLKDLRGHIIRDVAQGEQAQSGKDLTLSIDLRLQYLAYRELKSAMQRVDAKTGSIVMLDSHTGEVLAMVNQPSFNPNNRRKLRSSSLRNRAMTDVFEPGSTVKPLTVVAGLESGKYTPTTLVDTNPGYIRVGRKTLLDPVNHGVIDVTKILTKSSQVGISKLALNLDEQSVWKVFQRFGLGMSTGSGFPGERLGVLPNRPNWKDIERVNFAFGYGLAVTPIQLAQAYSVFASGGLLRPATLLRQDEPVKGERVLEEKIAHQVIDMMKTVTQKGGTATKAQVVSYSVAGKTGTIHKVGKFGYADDRYVSVFAGIAPATDPRIVAVVVIDEPQTGKYYGGEAAAPVFSKVAADALRILDVVPDRIVPKQQVIVESKKRMSKQEPSRGVSLRKSPLQKREA
jgi:cell division protein FtsI (penicillin-binding protein 3)